MSKETPNAPVVPCPDCGWPCQVSEVDGAATGDCPECGRSFVVDVDGEGGGEVREKVVLPTEKTGRMRESRAMRERREEQEKNEGVEKAEGDDYVGEAEGPAEHRLNPEKRTKLVPVSELAAETGTGSEWRVETLERPPDEEELAKRWSGKQFAMLGFLLMVIVAIGVGIYALQTEVETAPEGAGGPSEAELMKALTDELVGQMELFLAAEGDAERLALVRNPVLVNAKMADYYARNPGEATLKIEGFPIAVNLFERDGVDYAGVVLEFSDLTRRGAVFAKQVIEGDPEDEGRWLLDWESFVGYSEMELATFFADAPEREVTFRLRASSDDYFNFAYADDTTLDCYRLEAVDASESCWGYCEKSSEAGKRIARAVRIAERKRLPVAEVVLGISLKGEPPERKQVWIETFVQATHLAQ